MSRTAASATFTATCPGLVCLCRGTETVQARRGRDRRTGRPTITYAPCESLKAQGWHGNVATVAWDDAPVTVGYQHRDGLVTLTGRP